uniref:Uncharacterized protein n=1 Tax=Leishmania guyanensis TaxID=5670 RepID=A0A1E1J985_LEIGU|nr:Hypothetical protein BN36_NA76640 [Leishmania guyanensis]CCM20200.1 Hypothetical protein BN36_NA76980 [Leishmania guyanensis]
MLLLAHCAFERLQRQGCRCSTPRSVAMFGGAVPCEDAHHQRPGPRGRKRAAAHSTLKRASHLRRGRQAAHVALLDQT